jgi:hypothetical protein
VKGEIDSSTEEEQPLSMNLEDFEEALSVVGEIAKQDGKDVGLTNIKLWVCYGNFWRALRKNYPV